MSPVLEFNSTALPLAERPECIYGPVRDPVLDVSSMSYKVSGSSSTGLNAFSGVVGREVVVDFGANVRSVTRELERSFSKERACVMRSATLLPFSRTRAVAVMTESATGSFVLGCVLS